MDRKRIVLLVVFGALVALFYALDLGRFFTFQSLKQNRDALVRVADEHRLLSAVVFICIYILQTALALPGAAIMTMAAGAVFGVIKGTAYANIGATVGAVVAFIAARYLFHDAVQRRFGPRLEVLNRELDRSGLQYLLFLRFIPLFPFFLTNYAAGLTRLPLRTFVIGTMIGIIPGSFVFCNAGASLATIDSAAGILSSRVLGSFALLGALALVPVLYQKWSRRRA